MTRSTGAKASRRDFLKLAAGAAAFGPFFLFPERALASQKTLKIAKWAHFLPEFDRWFVNVLAKDWGTRNDTNVTVDIIPVEQIRDRAFAEVKAGKGHDLSIFPWPPAEFCHHTIDHGEIYQAVASRVGAIQQLAHRSTFNFQTKKYFGFADFWVPSPLHFFQDYWGPIGMPIGPVHYGGLLSGGKKIRDHFGVPCGLAFSPTLEGNVTLHTILYAFRAWIFDGYGGVVFNKNVFATTALKYIQFLYQQAGTPEQLTWSSTGNVRAMLAPQDFLQHQRHKSLAYGREGECRHSENNEATNSSDRQKRDGSYCAATRYQLFSSLELCSEPGRSKEVCRRSG
jgi:multiple sugar transport system substrate-binding protein